MVLKLKKISNRTLNYIAFAMIIAFFFISLASAQTYKINQAMNLTHSITVNASSTGITANITVQDPDDIYIVSFKQMALKSGSNEFTFTVPSGNITKTGIYPYTVCAYSVQENKCFSFEANVTPSGNDGSQVTWFWLILVLSYGVMIFGVWKQDLTISLLSNFSLYFVGIWMLFNGIDVFRNYLTHSFALITLGISFYLSYQIAEGYML